MHGAAELRGLAGCGVVRDVSLPAKQEQRARLDRLDRDPDILMEIGKRVAEGVSEYQAAQDAGFGLHRFYRWLHEPKYPERLQSYQFALRCHGRGLMHKAVEAAENDSPFVQRDRLKVETYMKIAPLYEPQFREAKAGVNISVGAGGSLIAILAGMDGHGRVPAPQSRLITQDVLDDPIYTEQAAPQGETPSTSESALEIPSPDGPAGLAAYADEELL